MTDNTQQSTHDMYFRTENLTTLTTDTRVGNSFFVHKKAQGQQRMESSHTLPGVGILGARDRLGACGGAGSRFPSTYQIVWKTVSSTASRVACHPRTRMDTRSHARSRIRAPRCALATTVHARTRQTKTLSKWNRSSTSNTEGTSAPRISPRISSRLASVLA